MKGKEEINNREQEKAKEVADFIRENSAKGKLTRYSDLFLESISLTENNINGVIEKLKDSVEFSDIVELKGKENQYLYSRKNMTDSYAKMIFRIEEKELLTLVVETVRHESKVYPRPTDIRIFANQPFNLTEEVLKDIYRRIKENNEYADIQQTKASNGAVYLYSNKYLSKEHAAALTEWIEVLQYQTP